MNKISDVRRFRGRNAEAGMQVIGVWEAAGSRTTAEPDECSQDRLATNVNQSPALNQTVPTATHRRNILRRRTFHRVRQIDGPDSVKRRAAPRTINGELGWWNVETGRSARDDASSRPQARRSSLGVRSDWRWCSERRSRQHWLKTRSPRRRTSNWLWANASPGTDTAAALNKQQITALPMNAASFRPPAKLTN